MRLVGPNSCLCSWQDLIQAQAGILRPRKIAGFKPITLFAVVAGCHNGRWRRLKIWRIK